MKFKNLTNTSLLTAALTAFAAWQAHSSLVINGDFSDGLNGWRATGTAVLDAGAVKLTDLDGSGGYLDQTIPLSAGETYTLSFDARADAGGQLYILFGSAPGYSYLPNPVLSTSFQHYTFEVTPTGSSAFLQFSTYAYGDYSYLDNVSLKLASDVTPVPEPTTAIAGACLLLPFCAGLLKLRRNR